MARARENGLPPHPIRVFAHARGEHLKDIAEQSGHEKAAISRIVNGHSLPELTTVIDIGEVLDDHELVRVLRPWLDTYRARQHLLHNGGTSK